jgi:hypothetical protein
VAEAASDRNSFSGEQNLLNDHLAEAVTELADRAVRWAGGSATRQARRRGRARAEVREDALDHGAFGEERSMRMGPPALRAGHGRPSRLSERYRAHAMKYRLPIPNVVTGCRVTRSGSR